jgi:hypothetical protein
MSHSSLYVYTQLLEVVFSKPSNSWVYGLMSTKNTETNSKKS